MSNLISSISFVSNRPLRTLLFAMVIPFFAACSLTTGNLEHPNWADEAAVFERSHEPLPLSIKFIRKSEKMGLPGYEAVTAALSEGPFSVVSDESESSDLIVEIDAAKYTTLGPLAFFGLLTAFVIPANSNFRVELKVDVLDRDNRLVRRYRKENHFTTWFGWIFFGWGVFSGNPTAEMDGVTDMARDIVQEMYVDDYDMYRARVPQEPRVSPVSLDIPN